MTAEVAIRPSLPKGGGHLRVTRDARLRRKPGFSEVTPYSSAQSTQSGSSARLLAGAKGVGCEFSAVYAGGTAVTAPMTRKMTISFQLVTVLYSITSLNIALYTPFTHFVDCVSFSTRSPQPDAGVTLTLLSRLGVLGSLTV